MNAVPQKYVDSLIICTMYRFIFLSFSEKKKMEEICKQQDGRFYCESTGQCLKPGKPCPQTSFKAGDPIGECGKKQKALCGRFSNQLQRAACERGVEAVFRPIGTLTMRTVKDMAYFPEGHLQGRILGRSCVDGILTPSTGGNNY